MEDEIIETCKDCGGTGVIAYDSENYDIPFEIVCPVCKGYGEVLMPVPPLDSTAEEKDDYFERVLRYFDLIPRGKK
jgi:hypothetical protein